MRLLLLCWIPLWLLTAATVIYLDDRTTLDTFLHLLKNEPYGLLMSLFLLLCVVSIPTYLLAIICFYIASEVCNKGSWLIRSLVLSLWYMPLLLCLNAEESAHDGKAPASTQGFHYIMVIFAVPSVVYVGLAQRQLSKQDRNKAAKKDNAIHTA